MKKIEVPGEDFFPELIKIAKEKKKEINAIWAKCELTEEDPNYLWPEEASEQTDKIEKYILHNCLSMYALCYYFDKFIDKPEDMLYNVTRVWIPEELNQRSKTHDKELLKELKELSEEELNKEMSWLYLFSGFAVDKEITQIEFREGYLEKRREEN